MKIYISSSLFGIFATDENGTYLNSVIIRKDHNKHFLESRSEQISEKEAELVKKLGKKGDLIFETKKTGYTYDFPNPAGEFIRDNLEEIAISYAGLDNKSLYSLIQDINIKQTSADIKSSIGDDNLIIQAVYTIDDLVKITNQMTMRLREWYGLYYPEFSDRCSSNEAFAKIVATETRRDQIKSFPLEENSMGADLKKEDLEKIKTYAERIMSIYNEITGLEAYISKKISILLPSTSKLINPLLAARLVAHANSTKRLAEFPSSTIQVIGAEKALFKHLQGHGSSPKHGLIFQEPLVNQAKRMHRGKIARHLASSISIALKIDIYGGEDIGEKMRSDLESICKKISAQQETRRPHKEKSFASHGRPQKKRFEKSFRR